MRQIHGFLYEKLVISRLNLKCINVIHTSKYDAYTQDNIPVQIKCIKFGSSIDLGDFKRNQTHNQNFIMVIGFWKENKTNIIQEYMLYFNNIIFNKFCEFEYTGQMLKELRYITNDKKDDKLWKHFIKKYKNLYSKQNLIKLRFKRDHKTQKRIQCAVNNRAFYKTFIHQASKYIKLL